MRKTRTKKLNNEKPNSGTSKRSVPCSLILMVVVAGLCLSSLNFSGCDRNRGNIQQGQNGQASNNQTEDVPSRRPVPVNKDIERPYKYVLAGMDPLVNELGFRRKIITRKQGVPYLNKPYGDIIGNLDFFEIYFVFDISPEDSKEGEVEYYCVGKEPRKPSLGWVSASDVASWDTRLGLKYERPDEESNKRRRVTTLLVLATKEDAMNYIKTGDTSKVIARTKLTGKTKPMPWPAIQFEYFNHGDRNYELAEINFLAEYIEGAEITEETIPREAAVRSSSSPLGKTEQSKIIKSIKNIDIVFVIDTTHSMSEYIQAVKDVMKMMVNQLKELSSTVNIAFRMVEYRDYVDNLYFDKAKRIVYRHHPSGGGFVDAVAFNNIINPIKDTPHSSIDYPEAVLDGMWQGIWESNWEARGKLSHRVVILMGNDGSHSPGSAKNPNKYTIDKIVDDARKKDITVYSIIVPCRSSNAAIVKLHKDHFTRLAKGTIGGNCWDLKEANKVVETIKNIVDKGVKTVGIRKEALVQWTKMPKKSQTNIEQSNIRNKVEILELQRFLQRRGITPEMIGISQPTFCSGWVVMGDNVDKMVYVAKTELSFLNAELHNIVTILERGEAGVQEIIHLADQTEKSRAGDLTSNFNVISFVLQEREGFISAYHNSLGVHTNEVLNITKQDLFNMSQSEKDNLRHKLQTFYIPSIINDLSNYDIFTFTGSQIKFGWVPNRHIP